jgi:hypothetical protein
MMTSKGAWMACGSLALLLAAQGPAHAHDYTFQVVATLGDPAPGGGNHEGDFEPEDINNRGSVLFASDLSQPGEGLFLRRRCIPACVLLLFLDDQSPRGSNDGAARLRCHFSRRVFVHQPEVMLSVLEMSFSFDRVSRRGRGPRERYVSLKAFSWIGGRIAAASRQT